MHDTIELPKADIGPLVTILPPAPPPMSPGAYLRLRREAARLGTRQAAACMAALPWSNSRVGLTELVQLAARLTAAEEDKIPFSRAQAEVLRNVFAFDVEIYCQLLDLHVAGAGCGLPEPQLCRVCACSWHDACETEAGPCEWTGHDPALCTACEHHPMLHVVESAPRSNSAALAPAGEA